MQVEILIFANNKIVIKLIQINHNMGKAPKYGAVVQYTKTLKGTSIGRRPITSTMNKNKRRQLGKKYREQFNKINVAKNILDIKK